MLEAEQNALVEWMTDRMTRKKLLILTLTFSIAGLLAFLYLHTRTTLSAEEIGRLGVNEAYDELCADELELNSLSGHDPFPAYSPDGRYYVEVHRLWPWEPGRRVIEMYAADSGASVGRYGSSEKTLLVLCWAQDSSGIFVADYTPASGSIFIGLGSPGRMGPVLKLFVPE